MIITIPLYFFLLLYLLFLTVVTVFLLINLYHIITSGSITIVSFLITFLVFAGLFFTFYATWQLTAYDQVDWGGTVILFNAEWFTHLFGQSSL
ncbi:MAG: hypothetical protein HOG08_02615 [Candidatus Magasanikbacteria bacterium]|jgi:hypothetical protein|nr:hypothetical protein [Candidatus Magasanikbacteria bacterium]